jgi:hypothetical protein
MIGLLIGNAIGGAARIVLVVAYAVLAIIELMPSLSSTLANVMIALFVKDVNAGNNDVFNQRLPKGLSLFYSATRLLADAAIVFFGLVLMDSFFDFITIEFDWLVFAAIAVVLLIVFGRIYGSSVVREGKRIEREVNERKEEREA